LLLALAVLALPLTGIRVERAPILTPLATLLVPLATSLELPPADHLYPPSSLGPAPLVLGSLSSACELNADGSGRLGSVTSLGFPDSRVLDRPNGRSPPTD
jgi:hypothetical protein